MIIEGPYTVRLAENTESLENEIHVQFNADFVELSQEERGTVFGKHLAALRVLSKNTSSDHLDYPGIMTLLQFCESIYPYILNGEVPLEDPIVIEVEQMTPLESFLRGGRIH